MKIIFYDFEVFAHDWMVVLIDYDTKEKTLIVNNPNELYEFYCSNVDSIWVGYNSRMYDQYILKGIILGKNPYDISTKLIVDDINGYNILPNHSSIHLNNFDISTGFHSLKQLEGFMGSKIKESDVDFNITRPLTQEELDEVALYCTHDVEETIKVFEARREEFDSQLSMIEAFELPMDMFNKTKAQLSAHVLGANTKKEYNDEFELDIPDTLVLSDKYQYVADWYKVKNNLDYSCKLCTEISNVPHIFAWGGIHGAIPNYIGEGLYIMSDIASMYPALMIEYNFLSRNVENPSKYREIRDTRIVMKKNKDPRQLPMKIVLNSTYGASKDKHNNLFDPRMANNVCVAGQLLLLDLIEKIEPYGQLIQSNTDGILVKVENEEMKEAYLKACDDWSKRTRLDLEHDEYVKVVQKDVNNYLIVDAKGKYKSKGAYVKQLSKIDYDLPIINEALVNYFTKNKSVEDTIYDCNDLIKFQKIIKISKLYKYAIHGDKVIKEKILRVFASTDESDVGVFKVKDEGRIEKISYTPEKCFIYNESVIDVKVPNKLDKQYYIEMANKRLQDFLSKDKKEQKPKSDIKGVNAIVKSEVEEFLSNDSSDSIFDFIHSLKQNVDINKSQFEALTKLNYFGNYCKAKKMLKCFEIYSELISKKQFKIKGLDLSKYNIDEIELSRFSTLNKNKTAYVELENELLLKFIFSKIDDDGFTLRERLAFDINYYGKLKLTNSKFPMNVYYVIEFETFKDKSKPVIQLYRLKDGQVIKTRIINSELFMNNPFNKHSIVVVNEFKEKPKRKKIGENWVKVDNEFDLIIEDYDIY